MSTYFPLFLTNPTVPGHFGTPSLLSFVFLTPPILHTLQLFLISCPLGPFHLPLANIAKITLARQGTENQTVLISEPSLSWLQNKAGPKDLELPQRLLRKLKQKAKDRASVLFICSRRYNLEFSRDTTVMYTSLWVCMSKILATSPCYLVPVGMSGRCTNQDCFNYKWDKEAWNSLS